MFFSGGSLLCFSQRQDAYPSLQLDIFIAFSTATPVTPPQQPKYQEIIEPVSTYVCLARGTSLMLAIDEHEFKTDCEDHCE